VSVPSRDRDIEENVMADLKWEPGLLDDDIVVRVRNGVVTLGGFVDCSGDRSKAERVAGRVQGVWAIVNELEIELPLDFEEPGTDIARAVLDALEWWRSMSQRLRARCRESLELGSHVGLRGRLMRD
jgi:hypothetical protein